MWGKLVQYIRETKSELIDKTTWPTKEAVLNSTVVVIVFDNHCFRMFVCGGFFH